MTATEAGAITADELDAALTYFRSRGVIHGDEAATHAATMQRWHAEVWWWIRDTEAEVAAARRSVARADAVKAAVQDAVDGAGSLTDVVAAIAAVLGIEARPQPALEQLGRAPRPTPTRRTV